MVASAGDVLTLELWRRSRSFGKPFQNFGYGVVNVVDLMAPQAPNQHPHGLSDEAFDGMFMTDRPVIFAYHGYPALIHRLTYRRTSHANFHVHGYQEEGTTTTPFDMAVINGIDRFHLAKAVVDRVTSLAGARVEFSRFAEGKLAEHFDYIRRHGEDMPVIIDWRWGV